MSPLREALLVTGAVFLALLTAWEALRARRAARRRNVAAAVAAAAPPVASAQPTVARGKSAAALTNPATLDTVPGFLAVPDTGAGPVVEWPPEGSRVIVAMRLV